MEYYRRCNICGHINCYTGEDIKNNMNNALFTGIAATGSISSAFNGNKYDMYELGKISNRTSSKIINYNKCTSCGSIDTFLITKKFAQLAYKNLGKLDESLLIEEAKKYLSNSDYENAFCFANVACHEDESSFEGYLIKFLATFKIKSIDEIKTIKDDYSENEHYLDLYNHSDIKFKNQLFDWWSETNKKQLKQQAQKLLNDNLTKKNLDELEELQILMEINKLTNDEDYKKIKEQIELIKKQVLNRKKLTKKVLLIIAFIILITIILTIIINQKNNYDKIMKLLENEKYYSAMTNYYEKLNPITKKKVKTYLIDKANKHTWASRRTDEYKDKNGNTCISREYITFNNNTMTTYIKCPEGYETIENLHKKSHPIDLKLNGYDNYYDEYQLSLVKNKYYLSLENNTYYITYDKTDRTKKVEDEISIKNAYVSITYYGGTNIHALNHNSYVIVDSDE